MINKIIQAKNALLLVVAVAALIMATQPFGLMTSNTQVVAACIILASGALLSVIAIRDKPRDERDDREGTPRLLLSS